MFKTGDFDVKDKTKEKPLEIFEVGRRLQSNSMVQVLNVTPKSVRERLHILRKN